MELQLVPFFNIWTVQNAQHSDTQSWLWWAR